MRVICNYLLLIVLGFSSAFPLLADPPEPDGRRLRVIVADKYPDNSIIIGGTTGSWAFGTETAFIMDREFSYVTPENDFKQSTIHPDNSDNWFWDDADAWVGHVADNNQVLRMHGPIGPQCSYWAKKDYRTASELETNMRDFMQALCQRYNGTPHFEYLDVVNETVIDGAWHTDKPGILDWECPWFKIGQDSDANNTPLYIKYAFEVAQEYAPDIKFIFNHHEDPTNTASWDLIKETVFYLRDLGLRVDGIGWQAHISSGWESEDKLNALRELIDWAHNNTLEFHITEASVYMENGYTQSELDKQAATYRAIVDILLEKRPQGKVGWNTWHIDDGHGWLPELYPSLFDTTYTAKPSYYALQSALESEPSSVGNAPVKHPRKYHLYSNFPNPFNPSTTITYTIGETSNVKLSVYNSLGQEVAVLVQGTKNKGTHRIRFNAANLSSGVYYYKIETGNFTKTKKMLLIR